MPRSPTGTGSWTEHTDVAAETTATTGQVFSQTYPGLGVLFHDVGNIIFSPGGVVIHGPHDIFEQGDAVFCDALAAIG